MMLVLIFLLKSHLRSCGDFESETTIEIIRMRTSEKQEDVSPHYYQMEDPISNSLRVEYSQGAVQTCYLQNF